MTDRATLDVDEAAKLLGLSRNATYAAVAAKQIPSLRIGRRIVIPRVALERLLEQPGARTVPPITPAA
jgi:excisionase family DNA binding protein